MTWYLKKAYHYDNWDDRYTFHVEMDNNAYVKVILKKLKWTFSTTTSLQHVKDKVKKYNEVLILHSLFFRLSDESPIPIVIINKKKECIYNQHFFNI